MPQFLKKTKPAFILISNLGEEGYRGAAARIDYAVN
jgi:hypothetical protein